MSQQPEPRFKPFHTHQLVLLCSSPQETEPAFLMTVDPRGLKPFDLAELLLKQSQHVVLAPAGRIKPQRVLDAVVRGSHGEMPDHDTPR